MATQVDRMQFRALVGMLLKIQVRGKNGKSSYGRLFATIFPYLFFSFFLGLQLSFSFSESSFVLVAQTMMFYMAGFSFTTSYPMILLDETIRLPLQQFPIPNKTFSLARIANLLIYIVFISVPFILPISLYFLYHTQDIWKTTVLAGTMLLSSLWTSILFLFVALRLLQKSAKSQYFLAVLQLILMVGLLFFFNAFQEHLVQKLPWDNIFHSAYMYVLPPFWVYCIYQVAVTLSANAYSFLWGGVFFLTGAVITYRVSRSWNIPLSFKNHSNVFGERHILQRITAATGKVIVDPVTKAGFMLFPEIIFRERTQMLQIVPMMIMPLAIAFYGIYTGGISSPFHSSSTNFATITSLYFYLTWHSMHVLLVSPTLQAEWFITTIPVNNLHAFNKGVRIAYNMYILFPFAIALSVLFSFAMPTFDAFLQGAFLLLAGILQTSIYSLVNKDIVFTLNNIQIRSLKRGLKDLQIIPSIIVFMILYMFALTSYLAFIVTLIVLCLIALFINRVLPKRTLVLPI